MKAAIGARLKRLIARLRIYWLAALLYEGWRRLVRPHTHGALVAIWCEEELLLVETSYRRSWSLPGGGIERGETARQAAVRELAEEVGLRVRAEQLLDPWQITERSPGSGRSRRWRGSCRATCAAISRNDRQCRQRVQRLHLRQLARGDALLSAAWVVGPSQIKG